MVAGGTFKKATTSVKVLWHKELKQKVTLSQKITKIIMAIHIRLIRNNIKSSSSYGKYFAKTVSQGEVTLKDMMRETLLARGYDEGAVVAVVSDLEHALKVKLSDGYTVVIPEIGRFSLRVESEGVDEPKQFSLRRHLTRIVCGFLPAGHRVGGRNILYNVCDGVTAVWQRGFKP